MNTIANNWFSDFRESITLKSTSAGLVATLFGCTGPVLLLVGAAEATQLTTGQTVAWLFSVYFLGGTISVIMALKYRQPICGAWTIPGFAVVIAALDGISFNEAVGSFIVSGILVAILGFTGAIGKFMRWLPMPIVMGMITGALIRFATGAVSAVGADPYAAGGAALAFFLTLRYARVFPPVLAAALTGFIIALMTGLIIPGSIDLTFIKPEFTTPSISLDAVLAVSLPLTVLVIGAENAQAAGILAVEGYKPPVNEMTVISGIGGILAGFMGGHNANIAGPMTAICASSEAGEDIKKRYTAAVINGILFASFGAIAGAAVPVIRILPSGLIIAIAGLAMFGVLLSTLQHAFNKDAGYQMAAFVALVVAMSNITVFGISAPFWALVAGVSVAMLSKTSKEKS